MRSRRATSSPNERVTKRRMKNLTSLVVAITLAACGGGNKQPATQTTAAPVVAASPGALEIAELKFYEGDDLGMQLHANGHLEVKMMHAEAGKPAQPSWHEVGALAADGTVSGPD